MSQPKSPRQIITQTRSAHLQLGIVGGGQLGRMLALAAAPLGIQVHILSEKESDPAVQICQKWQKGNPNSRKDVIEFCRNLDLLTFESEFYEMTTYFEAQQQSLQDSLNSRSLFIFPSPESMQILQSRDSQKAALVNAKIPTSDFLEVSSIADLEMAWKKFPQGFVLKKCRGGYDGIGTYYCRDDEDLQKLQALFPSNFIAEVLVPFKQELAVTLVRSRDGRIVELPLVQSQQRQSRCDWVVGPVKHPKFLGLVKKLKNLIAKIDYVGCISFEIFDTGKELLINEIAPRVHNSAHYSQDALSHSQFILHIQAGLGEKLTPPKLLAKAFCMVNLIGQSQDQAEIPRHLLSRLHWYGKLENRPGRKMGHLNDLGSNAQALLKKSLRERKKFKL